MGTQEGGRKKAERQQTHLVLVFSTYPHLPLLEGGVGGRFDTAPGEVALVDGVDCKGRGGREGWREGGRG
jgi:hypothetical protein